MTYKQIVDRVRAVAEAHKMIVDFGYGNLSDIKTNGDDAEADYPYVFLNPQTHQRTSQTITYRFNMIVMEMAKNDVEVLQVQSNCQQYIDDILAQLRFGYNDQVDLTLNLVLTPFKERFQDTVAGMTASLEIIVPSALNQCLAPFQPEIGDEYVHVTQLAAQTVDPDSGVPFGDVFRFTNEISDPENAWNVLRYDTPSDGTYTFVMEYSFQFENAPGVTAPPILSYRPTGLPTQYIDATTIEGWPSVPATGVTYNVKQTWKLIDMIDASQVYMQYYNTPSNEIALLVQPNSSLKIYRQ